MTTTTSTSVQLGQVLFSMGINALIATRPSFSVFVMYSLSRHKNADWGDLDQEDKNLNDLALTKEGRLLSSYQITAELDVPYKKIWIITEWDRSATTILFPSEY